jgi:hypothetical protein
MTWVMPVQLLPFAGVVAVVIAWSRLSKLTSHVRLFVDVLMIGVGTCAACGVAWPLYWWIEQRW